MGLYRDDGQQTDRTRKKIVKIFKETEFSIDITTKLVEVNFLDVTFNLLNETYRPYRKPNDELKYINVSSNHPPQIIKQLVSTINDRLSTNSSSKKVFNESKSYYEDALDKSGCKTQNTRHHQHQSIVTAKIEKERSSGSECFNKCSTNLP